MKKTLAAHILMQVGAWLCITGAVMASCPLQKRRERSSMVWALAGVAGALAIAGATTLYTSAGVSLTTINPTRPHSGVYGGIMDITFTAMVLFVLLSMAVVFNVIELFAAILIGGSSGGLWLMGILIEVGICFSAWWQCERKKEIGLVSQRKGDCFYSYTCSFG